MKRDDGFPLSARDLPHRLRVWIPSTQEALTRATGDIRRIAGLSGLSEERRTDVEITVREALANAIDHGSNGNGSPVFVRAYSGPSGLLVAVRDQGVGFDPAAVPDPRSPDRLRLDHGRGLLLMRSLSDGLEYRHGGREVVFFFRRR